MATPMLLAEADPALARSGWPRKSPWPARLDLLQSLSGLLLALFICGHMCFEGSILLGKDAMWQVSRFFEGAFFFDAPVPALVSLAALGVAALLVVHALLALRKFPINFRQLQAIVRHSRTLRMEDTRLWLIQALTGFFLFFLASAHLYQMIFWPEKIGPYASADRIWSDGLWPFYALLLITVGLHAGVGLYRLSLKWGWPRFLRTTLRRLMWTFVLLFIGIETATLVVYMEIGREHQGAYGERYTPPAIQETP
ncbi:MAG: fumarate reductase cytochrome b subunit [Zoogloeaceae bacterium]|jgi:fumarate reductase subunit C|nr:fumarate reductase cytochrome b subunit [Zoogloeaceae bacterium]